MSGVRKSARCAVLAAPGEETPEPAGPSAGATHMPRRSRNAALGRDGYPHLWRRVRPAARTCGAGHELWREVALVSAVPSTLRRSQKSGECHTSTPRASVQLGYSSTSHPHRRVRAREAPGDHVTPRTGLPVRGGPSSRRNWASRECSRTGRSSGSPPPLNSQRPPSRGRAEQRFESAVPADQESATGSCRALGWPLIGAEAGRRSRRGIRSTRRWTARGYGGRVGLSHVGAPRASTHRARG